MRKSLNKIHKTKKAETLLEVIIAIFILSLGATTASNLVISAVQSNSFSRDNLVAMNLAKEGIEAVKNIRDSNWLKFSSDKTNCWNQMPGADDCAYGAGGGDDNRIKAGNYTVDLDTTSMAWSLAEVGSVLTLDNANTDNSAYQLSVADQIIGDQNNSNLTVPLYVSGSSTGTKSKFYRMVQVKYIDETGAKIPLSSDSNPDTMLVTSVVEWKGGSAIHNVTLKTILTNYLKPVD